MIVVLIIINGIVHCYQYRLLDHDQCRDYAFQSFEIIVNGLQWAITVVIEYSTSYHNRIIQILLYLNRVRYGVDCIYFY